MGKHKSGLCGKCAEDLRGGAVFEVVEAAPKGLAVEGEADLPGLRKDGLKQAGMAAEDSFQCGRIKPQKDIADGGMRGRAAPVQAKGGVEIFTMHIDEGDDTTIGIGAGDDGEYGE